MGPKAMDSVAMQMNIRNNTMEMQDCIKDLYKWESGMHKKEEKLKNSRASQGHTEPAIRGKAATVTKTSDLELNKPAAALRHGSDAQKHSENQGPGATKTAAAHTYDYFKDRWDKFDVDAALVEVDQPAKRAKAPLTEVVESGNTRDEAPIRAPKAPEEERDMWKNKGNEYFKFGDFLKAKECYSSSLAVLESNAAYTNRALACIKLKEWQQAEEDCTQVTVSDPGNLKAWQRRAEARKGKGDTLGHVQDLDAALKLAPDSPAISQLLRQALPKYLTSKGLSMPSKRAAVHVEVDLNDPEPDRVPTQQEKQQPASQHQQASVSGATGMQEPTATNASTGESESLKATPPTQEHETAACHSSKSDVAPHTQIGSDQPADGPVSIPIVHEDSDLPGDAGSGSRPSSASRSVANAQVNLPPVETYIPSVAPTTSSDFECRWRTVKGDQAARAAYLDLIDPGSVVALFGSALTPDVLESVLRTLLMAIHCKESSEKVARRIKMLRELTRVQRFSMNLMLVAKGAKQGLAALWDQCINASDQDNMQLELSELKKLYKL